MIFKKKKSRIPTPVLALVAYCLAILTLIYSLKYATLLFAPVFFSFVLAYLFNPVVNYLENKFPISRGMASALMMIALVIFMAFALITLMPYIAEQIELAADKVPEMLKTFQTKMQALNDYLKEALGQYAQDLNLVSEIKKVLDSVKENLTSSIGAIFSGLYSVLIACLFLVFIPLITFYFLKDAYKIKRIFFGLIPPRYRDSANKRVEQMDTILSSFIRGQAIVVLILAVLYSVGLSLIGLPFAVIIGVIAGIGDIIPYLGTIIGFLISMVIGLAHFGAVNKLLLVMLIFAVVKGTENWFFYPKIVGREVGLHFIWVLVSIVVFGKLFGFWGLLVAIPSAAGFKIYVTDLVTYYKTSRYFNKEK